MPIDRDRLEALHARESDAFERRTRARASISPAPAGGCPTACRWPGWPGSSTTGRSSSPRGAGCRFTDLDGNEYLDFNQADLSASCGFAPAPVLEAIAERAARGLQFLLPVEEALAAAELLAERFALPAWQFTLSASGANAGGHPARPPPDRPRGDRRLRRPLPRAPRRHARGGRRGRGASGQLGVNPRAAVDTRIVPFNDAEALARVLARGGRGGDHGAGAHERRGRAARATASTRRSRALTRAHGALLVLDETHTQTAAYGGLHARLGPGARLVALGKSLGGGVPIGAYGMSGELRDRIERHRDALRRRRRDRHGRDDVRQPALARRGVATLAHVQTPDGVRAHRRARRAARRRDRGRRRTASACPGARTGSAGARATASSRSCRATARDAERSLDAG